MADTDHPRVSIGLPVFNGERYLRAALDSILGQSYADLELVVSDNGSSDATQEICEGYARGDQRVRYERLPVNQGARRNYENVLARSRGEYFKWSGHDDVLAPTFLARCVERLDADPGAVLCGTGIEVIDDQARRVGLQLRPILAHGGTPHERLREFFGHPKVHQTIFGLIRRSALEATGLFGHWFGADRALLMELVLLGRFDRVDEPLFLHREHLGRSDYADSTVTWWTPERGDRPTADHWLYAGRAARMLASVPMPAAERLRCLVECGRRGCARLPGWVPVMLQEATASVRAKATRG